RAGRGLRPVPPVPHQRPALVAGRVLAAGPRDRQHPARPALRVGRDRKEPKMKVSRLILCAALLSAAGRDAGAFCGFYVAKADTKLFNKTSQVALVRDGDKTAMTMANDFRGDLKEFAIVIPVPVVPKREQIEVSDKAVLDHLDAYSAPRLVEYF